MALPRPLFNLLNGIYGYILRPQPPFQLYLQFLLFHFRRERNLEFTQIPDVDVPFVEVLRTARVLDDRLRATLDSLVRIRRPPEFILDDSSRIIGRLVMIIVSYRLGKNPAYTGPVMTKLLDEVSDLAEAVFKFDINDFNSSCGLYHIIAVGILIRLRLSFLPFLGFDELPPFDFQGGHHCKYSRS